MDPQTVFILVVLSIALVMLVVVYVLYRLEREEFFFEEGIANLDPKSEVNLLHNIIKNSVEGMITIDERGKVVMYNPACERIFGYAPEEVIGQNIKMLMPEPYSSHHDGYINNYLETGERKVIGIGREVFGRHKDGLEFPLELSVSEFFTSKERMFCGIVRDITERKSIEDQLHTNMQEMEWFRQEAEKANRMKGDFLAMMSHEIRTPMHAIIGMADLLKGSGLDQQQDRYINTLSMSAASLLQLIDDVLDFSKIEAGKLSLDPVPVNLETTCQSIVEIFKLKAEEKGLDFEFAFGKKVPKYVQGDVVRIRQIVSNYLSNALKFTSRGKIKVMVEVLDAMPELLADVRIKISVQDSGIGLSEEARQKLFKEFSQADTSTTRKYGGTGLGLAICKKLAEMMGGEVGVDSVEGQGSTFWATMVLMKVSEEEVLHVDTKTTLDVDALKGARVLIAEDNPINQELIQEMLKGLGCDLLVVNNGKEAVDAAAANEKYDVILMDCQMPEMDGYEASRTLKLMMYNKQVEMTPIVAMTASSMKGDKEKCLKAGMDDYISKPFSKSDIQGMLKKILCEDVEPVVKEERPMVEELKPEKEDAVNVDTLANIEKLMGDRYKEMLQKFITSTDQAMGRMEGFLAEESASPSDLAIEAHTLKSSTAYMGAESVSDAAERLEIASKTLEEQGGEDLQALQKNYKALERAWVAARDFYSKQVA